MELYELDLKQLIEVKLHRLNKPKFSSNLLPISGSYNNIDDLHKIEDVDIFSQEIKYENLFKEYNLNDENSVSIDNMFNFNTTFGKVIFCETMEALLIINNISDKEIKIKDLKVKVSNEVLENYESMYKRCEFSLINSNNTIAIPANHFYNQKVKINADIMCKYSLEVDLQYSSYYFNEEYIKQSTNRIIKTIASGYSVELGTSNVIRKYYKKFLFATNLPFKIKDKFINDSLDRCLIEINLTNQSPYHLHINEFILNSDNNVNQNNLICLNEYKNFVIEPDEEINIVYIINNYKNLIFNVIYSNLEFICI
jgi:hypothetical protein